MENDTQIEQIHRYLTELKLPKIKEMLSDELHRLNQGESSTLQLLHRLFDAQAQYQCERRIERRIRESKLPERKMLADFNFDFQPSLDREQLLQLATMNFVHQRQGVILAGNSGTGKSHIAKALALEGCKQNIRVRYTTASDMLKTLFSSLADDSLDEKLKQYINPELLIIDELGFDRLEREDSRNANLFFKVIDGRYTKLSTVLTTNVDFEQLGHYLGDPVVTTAIVDRMVHHSTVISIEGPSWRVEESKKLNRREPEIDKKDTKKNDSSVKKSSKNPNVKAVTKKQQA
jgi:DNA replication protein DnaC